VVRWAAVRITARGLGLAAAFAMTTGLAAGVTAGRLEVGTPASAFHAGTRHSRSGRTAPPATAAATPAPAPAPATGTTTMMVSIRVGPMVRAYRLIRPVRPVAARIPALVMLHGVNATIDYEEQRDQLLPLAVTGQAVLAYPIGYEESWNAGVCCAPAAADGVDDVGFITAVIHQLSADPMVDPSRITLMGYSNGGRMAYEVDCARPGIVPAVVVLMAVPVTPCDASTPVSLLEVANQGDPAVPYDSGTGGPDGLTAVGDVVTAWRKRDGCAYAATARSTTGLLTSEAWSDCQSGERVVLATYAMQGHAWPGGDARTPSPGRLIWSFAVESTGLADPLPR